MINNIEGLSCTKPDGALYLFPKIDIERFGIKDDEQFILDFLRSEHVLMVQGTGFHMPGPDHFRIVFLPTVRALKQALGKLDKFLSNYQQSYRVSL